MRSSLTSTGSNLRAFSDRIEVVLLWIFTIMLVTDVMLGILARYVHFDVVFADELGKYLFIWLCTTGIAAATKDNQHVRLTFIASHLPLGRKVVRMISQLLFLAFSLFFIYWSARLTVMHFMMDKSAMGFRFPMYLFTAAVPFGFALTAVRLIQDFVSTIKKSEPEAVHESDEYAIKQ